MDVLQTETKLSTNLKIFEVFGLQYFSLNELTSDTLNVPSSTRRVIYVIFFISVLLSLAVVASTFVPKSVVEEHRETVNQNIVTTAIVQTLAFGRIFSVLFTVAYSYLKTSEFKRFFLNSREVRELMRDEFHVVADLKVIEIFFLKGLMTMTISFFTSYGVFMIFQASMIPFIVFVVMPTHFFLFMTFFRFILSVEMINIQLEGLNDALMKQICFDEVEFNFHAKMFALKSVKPDYELMRKLEMTRKIYNLIQENGFMINQANGFPMLMYIWLLVISVLAKGYEIFVISVGSAPNENLSGPITSIIQGVAAIISTVAYCQKTLSKVRIFDHLNASIELSHCQQGEKLATTIANIQSNLHDHLTIRMRELLQSFYSQLVIDPISFTACGCLKINLTLLTSFITGVLPYLIIMIQFYSV